MSFFVAADAYDRFMGRYSSPLAPQLADFAGVGRGSACSTSAAGPGALTAELVARAGCVGGRRRSTRRRPSSPRRASGIPGVDVRPGAGRGAAVRRRRVRRRARAARRPLHGRPGRGLAEMARVTRAGGVVAACVWDHAGGQSPLTLFWQAARELDPGRATTSRDLAGRARGRPRRAVRARPVCATSRRPRSRCTVEHATFEEWWEPFTLGVGPAGVYFASLDATKQAEFREAAGGHCPNRRSRCRPALTARGATRILRWAGH